MRQISSADFRKNYAKESEAVEVTAWGRVIGTWTPVDAEIEAPSGEFGNPLPEVADPEPEQRMTIRPAHHRQRQLVGQTQVLQDPLDLRKLEHERSERLASRMYRRKPVTRE